MSTKSAKSLNETLSEIFERSYSVRSPSPISLSELDDDEAIAQELLARMDAPVISKLRKCFRKPRLSSSSDLTSESTSLDRKVQECMKKAAQLEGINFSAVDPVKKNRMYCIDEEKFVSAIERIFGNCKFTTHAQKLFRILDPYSTRLMWWGDLLDKLVEYGARKNQSRSEKWIPIQDENIKMKEIFHCRKEPIVKIVSIETKKSFCYVVLSKNGKVGVYDGLMKLLSEYDIFQSRTRVQRKIKTIWVTDALFMEDTNTLLITASDRSVTIYDASTLCHHALFLITGISNIPTCLTYNPSLYKTDESYLFFGDDYGGVTTLCFKQPRFGLFHKKYADKLNDYFWIELMSPPHDEYCSVSTARKIHTRCVCRIYYSKQSDVIVTCSNDPTASLVIRHRVGIRDTYTFKVLRGITCFHMSPSLRVVVTGSFDGIVRLWDPVVTSKPFAILEGHAKPIIDVAVVASQELVLSFAKNGVVNLWDIYEEQLLQSIRIAFPFMGILGKRIEFGKNSLCPGPARKKAKEDTYFEINLGLRPPGDLSSRRSSKVYVNEAGGLKLEPEMEGETNTRDDDVLKFEQDIEYRKWDKLEFVVTCCDYIAIITYTKQDTRKNAHAEPKLTVDEATTSPLPPPEKMFRPRKPSIWNNDDIVTGSGQFIQMLQDRQREEAQVEPMLDIGHNFLSVPRGPSTSTSCSASYSFIDLDLNIDQLLEQAGLTEILEKDFVKALGLKHDLNMRLAELKSKQEMMKGPVSQCAPYITLDIHDFEDVKFSHALPISDRMKKRSGLEHFYGTDNFTNHTSCFAMSTPRSTYSCSTSRTLSRTGSERL